MKNTTRNILLGFALAVGVHALLAAVPSQTDFDGTYFKTNTLPISLTGNLTDWQQLGTNTFSSHWVDSGTSDATLAGTASAATGFSTGSVTNSVSWIACWGDSLTLGMVPVLSRQRPGFNFYAGGIGGQTSTQIKNRFIAATDLQTAGAAIFWVGRGNYSDTNAVVTDLATMVSALNPKRYVVMSILNATNEPAGNANYSIITNLNVMLHGIYGSRFLDIRSILIADYNPADPQDVIDHGNDVVPNSLRADSIHLNTAGYTIVSTNLLPYIDAWFVPSVINEYDLAESRSKRAWMPRSYGYSLFLGQDSGLGSGSAIAYSTLVGALTGSVGMTGDYNTALGAQALNNVTSGGYNVALGSFALLSDTTGEKNMAIGENALQANTIGSDNVGIGVNSLQNNISGSFNVGIGEQALAASTNTDGNIAIGALALYRSTSTYNDAIGYESMMAVTSGSNNVAVGTLSLKSNQTGNNNTAIGHHALYVTTGNANTALGYEALAGNQGGVGNVGVGFQAMGSVSANFNTAIGYAPLAGATGGNNVGVGAFAGESQTSATDNTLVGYGSGYTDITGNAVTSGSQNTYVGSQAGPGVTNQLANSSAIGYRAKATNSNEVVLGNSSVTAVRTFGALQTGGNTNLWILKAVTEGATTNIVVNINGKDYTFQAW